MRAIYLARLKGSSVRDLNRLRPLLQVDPDYQREGDVWDRRRRQLLIDSLINGFDVPKLYLRHFVPPVTIMGQLYEYAVIDGRQRLEALWAYLNDEFALAKDIAYIDDPSLSGRLADQRYSELSMTHPDIAARLMRYELDVITIETDDEDLIEDMFLRLNEAVPLNAAEKRNAYGGPVPGLSRELASHRFFTECLKVSNRRYRYYEIATKFMYFEYHQRVRDTKKVYLDRWVTDMRTSDDENKLKEAYNRSIARLDLLAGTFLYKDYLLDTVGMISVYYLVAMRAQDEGWSDEFTRQRFTGFHLRRQENKSAASQDEGAADYELLEFERFAQSPNDAIALRFRRDVLLEYLHHPTHEPLIEA